jgi:hypothetical protein
MSALDTLADRAEAASKRLAGQGGPSRQPTRKKRASGGPNPFLVLGVALVAGVALAKWIDRRGHAHPRW